MKKFQLLFVLSIQFIYCGAQTLVKDINPGIGDAQIYNFTALGNLTLFIATDGTDGWEIWKTDGTTLGTQMVKDINPGSGDGPRYNNGVGNAFSPLIAMGDRVYFFANNGVSGVELWSTDGTESGTHIVSDINPGSGDAIAYTTADFVLVGNNTLFFKAQNGTDGLELWKTDGTGAGTVMVKNINPAGDANPSGFFADGDTLYFMATDGTNGYELWKSDGSTLGTAMVVDIAPGSTSSFPNNLNKLGNKLIFMADDGIHGSELYISDGTASGTFMVKDIFTGAPDGALPPAVLYNNRLIFNGKQITSDYELWITDGTSAGTQRIKDIWPGSHGSYPHELTPFNGNVFFVASDSVHGDEIWTTDGTTGGTALFLDINNVTNHSSNVYVMQPANGYLYFAANDGTNGSEVWRTDGTVPGTTMLNQICPGSCSSAPEKFYQNGNTLYFMAYEPSTGRELYKLDLPTGISTVTNDDTRIYPNPVTDVLTVTNLDYNADLLITNLLGEVIIKTKADTDIKTIDVSRFAPGMYFINRHRFIKE